MKEPGKIHITEMFNLQRKVLKEFWYRYKKNQAAVIALVAVVFFATIALIQPYITPYRAIKTMTGKPFEDPSYNYFFGTDNIGRDIYSGVLEGIRISMYVGCSVAGIQAVIGILVGALSGYFGGRTDSILMRITEIFLVLPRFLIALIFSFLFGPTLTNVIIVLSLLGWPQTARLTRAEFLTLKNQEFVDAARIAGASSQNIIFKEILPNAMNPVIVNASMAVARAVTIEAGLSFLGASDPNVMSLGRQIHDSMRFLNLSVWMSIFPGLAIFLIVLSLNIVGDGLNDALNPRLRRR